MIGNGPRREGDGHLPLLFALVFLSGLTGLTYQVVWVRMLSDALGVTVLAVVSVLAVFMGGLALGSLIFGRVVDRVRSPARLYGILEIGIGAAALLILPLLAALTGWFDSLQRGRELSFASQVSARILYSAVVLLLPTLLMGGTFPALCRYLVPVGGGEGGRAIGRVYGLNTLGAVTGALLAGFLLIERFGLRQTVFAAAGLNGLVGLAAIFLYPGLAGGRGTGGGGDAAAPYPGGDAGGSVAPLILGVALVSGFVSIGLEVFWSKALVFFIGNSTYAVSLTLASFLLGIALGSLLFARLEGRIRRPLATYGALQAAVAAAGALTVPLLCRLFYSAGWIPLSVYFEVSAYESVSWTSNLLRIALTCLLVMIVPTTLMGVAFPLGASILVRTEKRVGRALGDLYAINTLGSILGAVLAGTLVISLFGVQKGIVVLASFSFAAGIYVLYRALPRRRGALTLSLVLFAALAVGGGRFLTLPGGFRSEMEGERDEVLYYREGIAGIVKVFRKPTGVKFMSVDGAVIGSTASDLQKKQKILAHLPALLARNPESALAVGLGSGITLGALGMHESFETIDCVEIVPEVVEGAAFFDRDSRGILDDPRARVRVDDGVVYLRTAERAYDVISSDAKLNHAYVGNGAVFSRAYYAHGLGRLSPGGVFCQWVPILLPEGEWKTVARTFLSAFPHVSLWFFEPAHAILVGSNEPLAVDPERLRRALSDGEIREELARFGLDSIGALLGSFICDTEALRRFVGEGPLHTFDRPTLEFRLPRAFAARRTHEVESENLEAIRALIGDVKRHLVPGAWESLAAGEREAIERSLEGTAPFLRGVAASSREAQLVAGLSGFEEAARIAPEDGRIRLLLDKIDAEADALARRTGGGGRFGDHFRLGIHRLQGGRFEEARMEFEAALALRPGDPDGLVNLGAALANLGRVEEAVGAWERAIESKPGERRAYLNIAGARREGGDPGGALEVLLLGRERCGENPALHYQLAETYLALGRREEALRHARRAAEGDPESPRFRALLDRLEE